MQALLKAVPRGSIIVLDLWSETVPVWTYTDSYYGTEFIWVCCCIKRMPLDLSYLTAEHAAQLWRAHWDVRASPTTCYLARKRT